MSTGLDRERLLNIAHYLLGQGYHEPPADAAAFLRNLAEHGWSGEGEELREALRRIADVRTDASMPGIAEGFERRGEIARAALSTQPDYGTGEKPPCEKCGGKGWVYGYVSDEDCPDCTGEKPVESGEGR